MIAEPDFRRWKGGRKAIRTQSLCEDVIFTATISTARFVATMTGTVATMTGTDTLHDTVGIAYQARFKDNIVVRNELIIENKITEQLIDFNRNLDVTSASSQVTKKIKRRRVYESTGLNIEPYCKRPKLQASDLLPKTDKRRKKHENQETGKTKNWKKM